MTRGRIRVLVTLTVGLAVLFGTEAPAQAVACSDKDQTFWADEPGSSWRSNAYGTLNDMRFVERDYAERCNTMISWTTAHVSLGTVFGNWVEIGWKVTETCVGSSCFFIYEWFSEWGLGSNQNGSASGSFPFAIQTGNFYRWRVTHRPVTNGTCMSTAFREQVTSCLIRRRTRGSRPAPLLLRWGVVEATVRG